MKWWDRWSAYVITDSIPSHGGSIAIVEQNGTILDIFKEAKALAMRSAIGYRNSPNLGTLTFLRQSFRGKVGGGLNKTSLQ